MVVLRVVAEQSAGLGLAWLQVRATVKKGEVTVSKTEGIPERGPMPLREREGCNARRGDKRCSVGGGRDERRLMG